MPSTEDERFPISVLVQTFFRAVHPHPECNFLHKAVFMNQKQHGQLDAGLLRAVCAMASLHHPDLKEEGARRADEAEHDILLSLTRPSVVHVQALQLVVLYRLATGDSRRVVSLFALCTRMAFLLRLNYEDPSLPFLAQESRRRLVWAIYVTDTFMSGGIDDLTLCRAPSIRLWLPSDEQTFELDQPPTKLTLRSNLSPASATPSILGFFMKVVDIRDRILRYTKSVTGIEADASEMQRAIQGFEFELDQQQKAWPENIVLNSKNLSLRSCSSSLSPYCLIHITWHQCHCDLYRFLTPGFRETSSSRLLYRIPQDFAKHCMSQCVAHAYSVAGLLGHLVDLDPETPLIAPSIALSAYQSANIVSRSVYMKETPPAPMEIKTAVSHCLRMVEKLRLYNPAVSPIQRDIQRLLDHGAPPVSQSRQQSPQPETSHGTPDTMSPAMPHKFSRYNVLDAANVDRSGEGLFFATPNSLPTPSANNPPTPTMQTGQLAPVEQQYPQNVFSGGGQQSQTNLMGENWGQLDDSWLMSVLRGPGQSELNGTFDAYFGPTNDFDYGSFSRPIG
ncbi:hypothetical protein MBLNU230_g6717t1 [Neophaeotheca triangularis]